MPTTDVLDLDDTILRIAESYPLVSAAHAWLREQPSWDAGAKAVITVLQLHETAPVDARREALRVLLDPRRATYKFTELDYYLGVDGAHEVAALTADRTDTHALRDALVAMMHLHDAHSSEHLTMCKEYIARVVRR